MTAPELSSNEVPPGKTSRQPWWPLLLILVVAVLMRIGYMSGIGHTLDLNTYRDWGQIVSHNGLFNVYRFIDDAYPPLYLAILGVVTKIQTIRGGSFDLLVDPFFVVLLKVTPVLADLLTIVVVYAWLRRERVLRWLIPLALAVSPALIADSAWWGQTDSLVTVFLVLALISLNRDRPWPAWVFFSVALLTKFQSVVLVPLMLVLTFRRYGLRAALIGLATGGVIAALVLAPFFAYSGLDRTLLPYLRGVDAAPYVTDNAYNFWRIVAPEPTPGVPFISAPKIMDWQSVLGPLTYKHLGLLMLAVYTLLISVSMWRWHGEKREFVWAAALYFGFFMLPTQIHERYIFPAALFSLIGIAQGTGLWVVALGVTFTTAQNILDLAQPMNWLGIAQPAYWPPDISLYVALLNGALMIEATRFAIRSPARVAVRRALRSITIGRLGVVLVVASLLLAVLTRLGS